MTEPILGPGDPADKVNSVIPDYAAYVQANTGLIESPEEIERFRESAVRIGVWNAVRIADSHNALFRVATELKRLGREAANNWASCARKNIEFDGISRLHQALDAIELPPVQSSDKAVTRG